MKRGRALNFLHYLFRSAGTLITSRESDHFAVAIIKSQQSKHVRPLGEQASNISAHKKGYGKFALDSYPDCAGGYNGAA